MSMSSAKTSTTLMQHGPRGCTRGEVGSVRERATTVVGSKQLPLALELHAQIQGGLGKFGASLGKQRTGGKFT